MRDAQQVGDLNPHVWFCEGGVCIRQAQGEALLRREFGYFILGHLSVGKTPLLDPQIWNNKCGNTC